MNLDEACALTADISTVCFTILRDMAQCEIFCRKNQFHSRQDYLESYVLEEILNEMDPSEVFCTSDVFQVHFVFCRVEAAALVIGPYCTESFGENDYHVLIQRKGLRGLSAKDLMAYRSRIPVLTESHVLHLLRCIAKNCGWETVPNRIRRVDFESTVRLSEEEQVHIPYTQEVIERYRVESEFMDSIARGDHVAAIAQWRQLHIHMAVFKRTLGAPLETARTSAAITRSMIRFAAMRAGIPPLVNDQVSGKSAAIIRKAATIDEIDREHERIIREYCRLIRQQKEKAHSSLTQSVCYFLENNYPKEISVRAIAQELDISVNHLIVRFRSETGYTPNQYLQEIRMQRAAEQLLHTQKPVQEIASHVGIQDANYFARLFRQWSGITPTAYRSQRG